MVIIAVVVTAAEEDAAVGMIAVVIIAVYWFPVDVAVLVISQSIISCMLILLHRSLILVII